MGALRAQNPRIEGKWAVGGQKFVRLGAGPGWWPAPEAPEGGDEGTVDRMGALRV